MKRIMMVCGWDWGAIAGFVAAAVGGIVGAIQAMIYKQQRDIQKRANDQALFDRRFIAYDSIKRLLAFATKENTTQLDTDTDYYKDYIRSRRLAPFIFSKTASDFIENIEYRIESLFKKRIAGAVNHHGYRRVSPMDEEESELLGGMKNDLEALDEIFREMKLID